MPETIATIIYVFFYFILPKQAIMGNRYVAKRAISRSGGDVGFDGELFHLAVARPGGKVCVDLE